MHVLFVLAVMLKAETSQVSPSPAMQAVPVLATSSSKWKPLSVQELAGTYFIGGFGLGSWQKTLKLTTEGTFEQKNSFVGNGINGHTEVEPASIWLQGTFTVEDGAIALHYEYEVGDFGPGERQGRHPVSPLRSSLKLLPVQWGERLYLLGEDTPHTLDDAVIYFCNSINFGEITLGPNNSKDATKFFLREGDENKTVRGWPILPEQWHDYLLNRPLVGKITQIAQGSPTVFNLDNPAFSFEGDSAVVTINIGSAEGVKKGMWFTDKRGNDRLHRFIVDHVEEHTATLSDLDVGKIANEVGEELTAPASKD